MLGVSCQESVVFSEGFTVQWGETWALATICPWSAAPIKVPSTSMVIPKKWKHKCALRMRILLICVTEEKCHQTISFYRNEQCKEQQNWKVSNRTVSRKESFVIYFSDQLWEETSMKEPFPYKLHERCWMLRLRATRGHGDLSSWGPEWNYFLNAIFSKAGLRVMTSDCSSQTWQ